MQTPDCASPPKKAAAAMKKRPERLDDAVKRLLEERRGTWQEIADASDVSFSWISKFMCNRIPNASYTQLQKLKDYLTD